MQILSLGSFFTDIISARPFKKFLLDDLLIEELIGIALGLIIAKFCGWSFSVAALVGMMYGALSYLLWLIFARMHAPRHIDLLAASISLSLPLLLVIGTAIGLLAMPFIIKEVHHETYLGPPGKE